MRLTILRLRYLAALSMPLAGLVLGGCEQRERYPDKRVRPTKVKVAASGFEGKCAGGKFCLPAPDAGHQCASSVALPASVKPHWPEKVRATIRVKLDPKATAAKQAKACCYLWYEACGGRPLRYGGAPIIAPPRDTAEWTLASDLAELGQLAPDDRQALAEHWLREAGYEHASVASFAQAVLQLMALGAPPELLEAYHQAAIDEVRHAQLTYALASVCHGEPLGPDRLPLERASSGAEPPSLATLLEETFRDGCVNETLAAALAREACVRVVGDDRWQGRVRELLTTIACDEERHAELAWRTLAWLVQEGGSEADEQLGELVERLEQERATAAADRSAEQSDGREHCGILATSTRRAACGQIVDEVILPCARALLASA